MSMCFEKLRMERRKELDLTKEAKVYTMEQLLKLQAAIAPLVKGETGDTDALFARKLGDALIACEVFVSNTKHQHRTICDVVKGKRA